MPVLDGRLVVISSAQDFQSLPLRIEQKAPRCFHMSQYLVNEILSKFPSRIFDNPVFDLSMNVQCLKQRRNRIDR